MAKNVYPLPSGLVQSVTMGPQHRSVVERKFFGGTSQVSEVTPRRSLRLEGVVHKNNHVSLATWLDRLAVGGALAAVCDRAHRVRQGWDALPAINSSGTEYWRESGATAAFPGGTPTSPWRTAACAANGAASADATSIAVDGLLANEVVAAGTPARIGNWIYMVRTAATANASGEVTLSLGHPLRADVSDGATVTVPGDLGLFEPVAMPDLGPSDQQGVGSFVLEMEEVYSSEVTGGVTWVVD